MSDNEIRGPLSKARVRIRQLEASHARLLAALETIRDYTPSQHDLAWVPDVETQEFIVKTLKDFARNAIKEAKEL